MKKKSKLQPWPVLTRYDQNHLRQIALPLGGIGTGTISLGGRGQLCSWEVGNRPAKTFIPKRTFFALYAKPAGGESVTRMLEGIIPEPYEGSAGATAPNHGLPRFRHAAFEAAYPFGQVLLADPDVPVEVRLQGFNPLVPADADASGIPVAVLRFVLTNKTNKTVSASICGNMQNFIGTDGAHGQSVWNVNEFRGPADKAGIKGIYMRSNGTGAESEFSGTLALTTDAKDVTYRTSWLPGGWDIPVQDFWDDFSSDGRLENRPKTEEHDPLSSLSTSVKLPPRGECCVTFMITWHFPNRQNWAAATGTPVGNAPAKKPTAMTGFVKNWQISEFLPLEGAFVALPLPSSFDALGMKDRVFGNDFSELHSEIASRGAKNEIVYYRSKFTCAERMQLTALLGYDGPVKMWLDGREIYCDDTGTNPAIQDEGEAAFQAEAGEHEIVVMLGTNMGAAWGVFLRLKRTDISKATLKKGPEAFILPEIAMPPASGCGCQGGCDTTPSTRVGNYYTTRYADAWDVALKTFKSLPSLEARTLSFVQAFCETDLPQAVKEAALYNLSTLRSQTCFRIEEGHLMGWEGCSDACGCCNGSCTHVWNYENATGFLFGDLAWTMREAEFKYSTGDDGLMSFRVGLPLSNAKQWRAGAADGQMGAIMRLYREWQLSGDEARLRELWPQARKALEYCWVPGGWDADKDGVMEGCQHNTMDVEYYGPNPQMGIWYLGALRSCEEMARHLGENDFAAECRGLFERGRDWLDANLFNGDYYEHQIRPPTGEAAIAPGLRVGMGAANLADPDFQLGNGCLIDQLVGQYMAHALELGYLTRPANVRKTLQSIMKNNFRETMFAHFNHLRSYALNDESALLMASYPRGSRLKRPFPYYNEVMTGFEYTAAVGMIYEGQTADGLKCIRAIRKRYDGSRRSPFDEAECGHHYARAMASWTAVLALTGFHYTAVGKKMTLAAKEGTVFWSTGYAWGTCRQKRIKAGMQVELQVLEGELGLKEFVLRRQGTVSFPAARRLKTGTVLKMLIPKS